MSQDIRAERKIKRTENIVLKSLQSCNRAMGIDVPMNDMRDVCISELFA